MLRHHAIYILVKLAGTAVVIGGPGEPHVYALLHEFADDHIIAFVSARPVIAKKNDAFEQPHAQKPAELMEFRSVNVVLHPSVNRYHHVIILMEGRVLFTYDPVFAESFQRARCDLEFFTLGKAGVLAFLIFDGVLLVVRLVGAFAIINNIAVPVFAGQNTLQDVIIFRRIDHFFILALFGLSAPMAAAFSVSS